MTAPSPKEALEDLQHFSETQLDRNPKMQKVVATVVAALATLSPPAGERREAIAKALAEKWPGDYMQGDDEGQREPNELAYETADLILASGLVQDEAGIREREQAAQATLARIRKVRDGYADQAKFADVDPASYFREFVRRLDDAVNSKAKLPSWNGRSARDGGAES